MKLNYFHNRKKASANMWWIIIGAVIALVVMIVLMVLFTGKTSSLETGLLDCGSKSGECVPSDKENPTTAECQKTCKGKGKSYSSTFTCPLEDNEKNKKCCCLGAKVS